MHVEAIILVTDKIIPQENMPAFQRWEVDALDQPAITALPDNDALKRRAYEQGLAEGRAAGIAQATRIATLAAEFEQALKRVEEELNNDVLHLALTIAKQMLRETLRVRPEKVVPVVREALAALPHINAHLHLTVHPEDAALLRSFLEAELGHGGWRLLEDANIERGGCRIETSNSELDATLEARWKRIVAALGQENEWRED